MITRFLEALGYLCVPERYYLRNAKSRSHEANVRSAPASDARREISFSGKHRRYIESAIPLTFVTRYDLS